MVKITIQRHHGIFIIKFKASKAYREHTEYNKYNAVWNILPFVAYHEKKIILIVKAFYVAIF